MANASVGRLQRPPPVAPTTASATTSHLPILRVSFPDFSVAFPLVVTAVPAAASRPTALRRWFHSTECCMASTSYADVNKVSDTNIGHGYTMNQFCDKMIQYFMNEKKLTKDWRKILVFRDEWKKYKDHFFSRCRQRMESERDPAMKQNLDALSRKVKKIDDEMEKHAKLLEEIQDNPVDINAIVAKRRSDFSGEFFQHLNILSETYNSLDERDAIVRLGAKCLSAVRAFDCAVEQLGSSQDAQSKFDDILNSASLTEACEKIKSMAKAKQLDSSLVLLINRAWATAKESPTMKNEVKGIMYNIYKTTNKSLKSISPPEITLVKYLLNFADPEERFAALATAFCPGDNYEVKGSKSLHSTPKELHKWIKILLDAYYLNREETDLIEARKMSDPVVIQRLNILKETIEEEYMKTYVHQDDVHQDDKPSMDDQ